MQTCVYQHSVFVQDFISNSREECFTVKKQILDLKL